MLTRGDIAFPAQNMGGGRGFSWSLQSAASNLGRMSLGIREDLKVEEWTYRPEIQSPIEENRTGYVRLYHRYDPAPQKPGEDAIVIVLPPRGRGFNVAQLIASYLASHGLNAVDLELPLRGRRLPPDASGFEDLRPTLEQVVQTFQQSVNEACSLATTLLTEGYSKVGICGISIGALFGSIVYGADKRLQCACLALAGGNLPALIRDSDDALAKHLKRYIIQQGISWDTVSEIVKSVDPLTFADSSRKGGLLMITALHDKVVLNGEAKRLWAAWGEPKEIKVQASHYSIFKNAALLLREAYAHLSRFLL
ncbi:alpha/beta hydrolase family protein [Candidatus Woesearchaeota archaeon]|nr:alpha/beta hydrolase family protein [Candidatus Woesearchaeota archaeon]